MVRKAQVGAILGQSRVDDNKKRNQSGPKYLQLETKETRLWPGQIADLDALARELNRERGPGNGERITANTLLRVAAAWLLETGARNLQGVNEEELAESLKLRNYPPT